MGKIITISRASVTRGKKATEIANYKSHDNKGKQVHNTNNSEGEKNFICLATDSKLPFLHRLPQ